MKLAKVGAFILGFAIGWAAFVILTLIVHEAHGFDSNKHPIYKQIIKNKPKISKKYAMELSNIIHRLSKKYNIDSRIYTAILAQESGYNLAAKNCVSGYAAGTGEIVKICADIGISQLNYRNIEKLKLDVDRLQVDLEYSVEAGANILSNFKKRYSKKEPVSYWSRYNSSTPSKRRIYELLVERYL